MVVFWKWVEKEDEETGDVKEIPFLRYYNVFHIDQCEGLKTRHAEPLPQTANADQKAEAIICDYLKTSRRKAEPRTGRQSLLSSLGRFHHASSVGPIQGNRRILLHGLPRTDPQHGTRQEAEQNRRTAFFGSEAYSKEELVAEIGASALVHAAGLETPDSFRNNVGYIQNWLRVLRNDRKVIVSASGRADKAVSYIRTHRGFKPLPWRASIWKTLCGRLAKSWQRCELSLKGPSCCSTCQRERDTLETALYHLKDRISELQEAYRQHLSRKSRFDSFTDSVYRFDSFRGCFRASETVSDNKCLI